MTKPITVVCDKCGELTETHLKKRQHPNSVQETYFKCTHCFWQYTVSVTDKKVRKMQRRMKQEHNPYKRSELHSKIKQHMQKLKYNQVKYGRADL